ncbi:hypothetical protein [Mycobacterium intracellulare]|uniref:hypothetical protein n=1 Tax=Mycobacterium intracellulare TaxID=1767 RepID=UPI000A6335D3|nr:hypothetical protein [Mycobacterium intracellulare]
MTVKNRIEKLEAEQRGDQRILDGYRRVVARTATYEYVDEFAPASGSYREQVIARMAQRGDQIAYWKAVYADLQASGAANPHSRDSITKGDLIKYRGHWYPRGSGQLQNRVGPPARAGLVDRQDRLPRDLRPSPRRRYHHD